MAGLENRFQKDRQLLLRAIQLVFYSLGTSRVLQRVRACNLRFPDLRRLTTQRMIGKTVSVVR